MTRSVVAFIILMVVTASLVRAESHEILRNLFGYWDFEKMPGKPQVILDRSSLNHHGASRDLFNMSNRQFAAESVPGILGNGLATVGPDHPIAIQVPYPLQLKTVYTFAIWGWMDRATPDATLACNLHEETAAYGQFRLCVRGGRVWAIFGVLNPDAPQDFPGPFEAMSTDARWPIHEWHHLALVIDEPDTVLYMDGVEIGRLMLRHPLCNYVINRVVCGAGRLPVESKAPLTVLKQITYDEWQGRIDEVAAWTRPLTAAEVRGVYAITLAGKPVYDARPIEAASGSPIADWLKPAWWGWLASAVGAVGGGICYRTVRRRQRHKAFS